MPVYGLAESSVGALLSAAGPRPARRPCERASRSSATGAPYAAATGDASAAASSSRSDGALPEHEVRIVDDEAGGDVPERVVGRLRVPRPLDHARLLPQARGDRRRSRCRRLARQRRSRVPRGRRALRHRPAQGPHHQGRPQPGAAGDRGGGGCGRQACAAAASSRSACRTKRSAPRALVVVAETRATDAGRARRGSRTRVTERVAAAVELPPDGRAGRARRRAEDLERKDPAIRPPGSSTWPGHWAGRSARRSLSSCGSRARRPPSGCGRSRCASAAGSTPSGSDSCSQPSCCRRGRSRRSCRAGASPSRSRALRHAPCCASGAAASTRRASIGCRGAARWCWPATTPPTPTSRRSSRCCRSTCCSSPSARSFRYPVIGSFVRRCGHLTVDRWDALQSVADADQVARALGAGSNVLFFPEGTFVAATGLRPFRLGAFSAAARAGAPIVPLALRGTRRVLRGDPRLPRPGAISLWVGEPIAARRLRAGGVVALRARVADAIAAECGEPRLDLVAAGPARETVSVAREPPCRSRRRRAGTRRRRASTAANAAASDAWRLRARDAAAQARVLAADGVVQGEGAP